MTTSVRRTVVSGFEGIVLENSRVRAVVLPSLGGRIWELEDRIRGRQWIWHREDVVLAAPKPESVYDDVWAGGWEELFPNDAPGRFEGRALPDHGEWWTLAWSVTETSEGAEAFLRLETMTRIRAASCVKEFRLAADDDTLRIAYRIQSCEAEAFHFLFKQHLPIALTPSCRLVLPGGLVTSVDPTFGTLLRSPGPVEWPCRGSAIGRLGDLRQVPRRSSGARDFLYVTRLPAGWCGIDDIGQRASLRLRFDLSDVPFLWLFLTYGGWRGCYTAVLEPCTNMPKELSHAVRLGQSASLSPSGVFQTRASVTLSELSEAD
jgi:hypothetical protein